MSHYDIYDEIIKTSKSQMLIASRQTTIPAAPKTSSGSKKPSVPEKACAPKTPSAPKTSKLRPYMPDGAKPTPIDNDKFINILLQQMWGQEAFKELPTSMTGDAEARKDVDDDIKGMLDERDIYGWEVDELGLPSISTVCGEEGEEVVRIGELIVTDVFEASIAAAKAATINYAYKTLGDTMTALAGAGIDEKMFRKWYTRYCEYTKEPETSELLLLTMSNVCAEKFSRFKAICMGFK